MGTEKSDDLLQLVIPLQTHTTSTMFKQLKIPLMMLRILATEIKLK